MTTRLHIISLGLTAAATAGWCAATRLAGPLLCLSLCAIAATTLALWRERRSRAELVKQLRHAASLAAAGSTVSLVTDSSTPADRHAADQLGAAADALVAAYSAGMATLHDRLNAAELQLSAMSLMKDEERQALETLTGGLNEVLHAMPSAPEDAFPVLVPQTRPAIMMPGWVTLISHSLRTPLTSIRAYAEMLLDSDALDEPQRRTAFQIMHGESCRLTQAVDSLLCLAALRMGGRHAKLGALDFRAVLSAAHRAAQPIADSHQVTLSVDCSGNSLICSLDAELMQQAVANLLVRAIVRTPSSERVEATIRAAPGDRLALRVASSRKKRDATPAIDQPQQEIGWMLSRHVIQRLHEGVLVEADGGTATAIEMELPLARAPRAADGKVNS